MRDIFDTDTAPRCENVKIVIIIIDLTCTPISFILLMFATLKMIFTKKKIGFLSSVIILVFISEIINTISKLLQLTKFFFDNGIICEIQIATSMYSDYCTLLGTLLLSLRCYDVVKNKKGFFTKDKCRVISIFIVIAISILFSIGFLFADIRISNGDKVYGYDDRDKCSYWCWLNHKTSLVCYIIYWIILITEIIFACKMKNVFKKEYDKLKQIKYSDNSKSLMGPLTEITQDNNSSKNSENYSSLTDEEKKRAEQLKKMIKNCFIYIYITIIIWLFFAIHRVLDDILDAQFDDPDRSVVEDRKEENEFYEDYPLVHFIVQFFLVIHTFLSSTRGIFYGFSFIVFEYKTFFNLFEKCFSKKKNAELKEEEEEEEIKSGDNNRYSNVSGNTNRKTDYENQEDIEQRDTIEMNNSDYHFEQSS